MTEIKVMSIQDLLHIKGLKDSIETLIVFVTIKPNYYNFGYTRFIQLNIADTDAPVISKKDIRKLQTITVKDSLTYIETIYICCDIGISRSPAIAQFIAIEIEEFAQAKEINKKYRFLNTALYRKLMKVM